MIKTIVLLSSLLVGVSAVASVRIRAGADCAGLMLRNVERTQQGLKLELDMRKVSFGKNIYAAVTSMEDYNKFGSSQPQLAQWYPASGESIAEAIYKGEQGGFERIQMNYQGTQSDSLYVSIWLVDNDGRPALSCVGNRVTLSAE